MRFVILDHTDQDRGVTHLYARERRLHAAIEAIVAEQCEVARFRAEMSLGPPAKFGSGKQVHFDKASSSSDRITANSAPPERMANIETPSISICSPRSTRSYMTGRETSASRLPRT
jgi:hypothetical protein